MKKILILPLLALIIGNVTAQSLTKKQAEYFILGTLSDTDGRFIYINNRDEFDHYFQWEKPLVSMIDSILKANYSGMSFQLTQNQHPEGIPQYYFINSKSLCDKFNHYYKFEPTGSLTFPTGDTEYHGLLSDSIFHSEDQKLAFLAGVYVRFGEPTDTAYCIHIPESLSKVKVCYDILKGLKCRCSYQILNNIPTQVLVYFHPTTQVKAYLKKNSYLNAEVIRTRSLIFENIYDHYREKE